MSVGTGVEVGNGVAVGGGATKRWLPAFTTTMSNAMTKAMRRILAPRATSSRRPCPLSINPQALGPDEDHFAAGQSLVTQQSRSIQGGDARRLPAGRERHKTSVVPVCRQSRRATIDKSAKTPIR